LFVRLDEVNEETKWTVKAIRLLRTKVADYRPYSSGP